MNAGIVGERTRRWGNGWWVGAMLCCVLAVVAYYTLDAPDKDLSFDTRDSQAFVPKCRVIDPAFTWGPERKPRVPWERTILGGFSQGTVMAYALGLGSGQPEPAGIIAMSGFIPTVDGWGADLDRPGLPVWIAHGRRDPVISVEFARDAHARLDAAGADVVYHEHDGGHQVDPRLLAELPAWVAGAVDRAGTRAPG